MTRSLRSPGHALASRLPRITLLMATLVTLACGEDLLIPSDGYLALGTWGGEGAGVIATDSVTHVHVGCTFGDVPGRIQLEPDGRFTISGSYVLQAYPVLVGPSLPAQFSGRVRGRTLSLAIAVNDTIEKKPVALGPISVVLGREPDLGPCPICAVPRSRR